MSMEFYSSKDIKKTRKAHKCEHCFLSIPKGSTCLYEAGKWEGDFFSHHTHNECANEYKDINKYTDCGDEWLPLDQMQEVYPHTSFSSWVRYIGDKYKVEIPERHL